MPASFHHLIIAASDRDASAAYFANLLELSEPWPNGFFLSLQLDDEVVVNFAAPGVEVQPQHYAFLIAEDHFDRIRMRFDDEGTTYWADPRRSRPGEIGEVAADGFGRRLYFIGPDGHYLEVLTARYPDTPA